MSDFEDDFVEVSGYHSNSDSDWERIDGYSSGFSSDAEELASSNVNNKVDPSYHTVVHSYYRSPDNTHTQHLQEHKVPTHTSGNVSNNTHGVSEEDEDISNKTRKGRNNKKAKKLKEARRRQWTKLSLQSGHGAPYDPVEFLGITGADKALLSRFGITTIGQLAHLNAVDFISSMEPDKLGIILDLQERAYEAVTAFVTKASSQPEVVWGYLYLGDETVSSILKKGYIDSDAHYFVWSPMPSVTYRDQRALDTIVGRETKNRDLCNRYSRYIKINLSKLCEKYYGRLYMRDPQDTRAKGKWQALTIMEAAGLSQREDLWYPFEAGDEIYSRICHGSIVIPTGRIPKDCVELDKEECSFDDRMCPDVDSDHDHEHLERTTAIDEIINNY